MSTLSRAVEIAAGAHADQKRWDGSPYILHPLRVMMKMPDDDHRIAAVLHDVVEDTPWTLQGLYVEGFSDTIIDAVEYLTHLEDEGYETYIGRMIGDAYLGFEGAKIALHVKLADLEDNMDVFHNMKFTTAGLKRYLKAVKAIKRTLDTVEGGDHV